MWLLAVAPTVDKSVTEVNTTAGNPVTLECRASGNPIPMIYWTFKGMNITSNGHYNIVFDEGISTIQIFKTTIEDFGVYTCTAVNEEGQSSHDITVIVFSKNFLPWKCKILIIFLLQLHQHSTS